MKIKLKHYYQQVDYSCGPACLKMIFEYFGKKYSEKKLTSICQISKKRGASHDCIIEGIKAEGFSCQVKIKGKIKDLIKFLEEGHPILVNYSEPSADEGHYAVVVGYNKEKKKIILADPHHGNDFMIEQFEFCKRWHNHQKTSRGWLVVVKNKKVK